MRKSHECHSEPQVKNLTFTAAYESEILRLLPQDDIATQSLKGEEVIELTGDKSLASAYRLRARRVRFYAIANTKER